MFCYGSLKPQEKIKQKHKTPSISAIIIITETNDAVN